MARVISYRDLPLAMSVSGKGLKRSAAMAINDTAFAILPKLVKDGEGSMKFRGNARRAQGWQIGRDKATPAKPEAAISTRRGWLAFHIDKGTRSARSGQFQLNGRNLLFIPLEEKKQQVTTGRGKIRASYLKGLFLVPRGSGAMVFYRQRRGKKESELIGFAVPEAKYKKEFDWDDFISDQWRKLAPDKLRKRILDRRSFERR